MGGCVGEEPRTDLSPAEEPRFFLLFPELFFSPSFSFFSFFPSSTTSFPAPAKRAREERAAERVRKEGSPPPPPPPPSSSEEEEEEREKKVVRNPRQPPVVWGFGEGGWVGWVKKNEAS